MKEILAEQEGELRPRKDFPAFEEAIWSNESPHKSKNFQEEIYCSIPATLKGSPLSFCFHSPLLPVALLQGCSSERFSVLS